MSATAGQSGSIALGAAGSAVSSAANMAPLGAACAAGGPSQCASGRCADGVCCVVETCETCHRCGSTGMCEPVRNGMLGTCSGKLHCDAQARCVGSIGASCRADNECEAGSCLDQVCCAASCGVCSACDSVGSSGRCAPVIGNDDADTCHDSQTCDSTGVCASVGIAHVQRGATWFRFGVTDAPRRAQSFSLPRSASLIEIHVDLNCEEDSELTAELEEMTDGGAPRPSGAVIGSLRDAGVGQAGLRMLVLERAVALDAGHVVALVLGTNRGTCALNSAVGSAPGPAYAESPDTSGWMLGPEFAFKVLVR